MNEEFIKLPRNITSWRWYTDANVFRLYIHLLFKSNFTDAEWRNETIKKGQLVTGRKKLAEELGISESAVRTALTKLEETGAVSIKTTTNKYSIITISNWQETQRNVYFFTGSSPTNRQQITNKSPQYNKEKKENNAKNYNARPREKIQV